MFAIADLDLSERPATSWGVFLVAVDMGSARQENVFATKASLGPLVTKPPVQEQIVVVTEYAKRIGAMRASSHVSASQDGEDGTVLPRFVL